MISRNETNYLKAIAIILVISEHLWGAFGNGNEQIRNLMGTGSVCLFLVLSGYGVYMSYFENGLSFDYWDKKVNKIFVPYWIVTLIYVFIFKREISAIILMKNLLCIDYERNIDGTMWYMSLLLMYYIIFYILFRMRTNDIMKIIILFVAAFCIKDLAQENQFINCSWQFCNNFLSFPVGVMLAWGTTNRKLVFSKRVGLVLKSTVIALGFILYLYVLKRKPNNFQISGILFSMICICLVSCISCIIRGRMQKVWMWIGMNSYMLYLLEGKLVNLKQYYAVSTISCVNVLVYIILLVIIMTMVLKVKTGFHDLG